MDLAFRDPTLKVELLISLRRLAAIVPQSEKTNADWLNRTVTDSVHQPKKCNLHLIYFDIFCKEGGFNVSKPRRETLSLLELKIDAS